MERHLLTDLSKKFKEQMLSCIVYKRTFNPSMFVIPCMITVHQAIPTPIFPHSYVPSVLFISLKIRLTKFSPFCCLDLRCRSSYCRRALNPAFFQVQVFKQVSFDSWFHSFMNTSHAILLFSSNYKFIRLQ